MTDPIKDDLRKLSPIGKWKILDLAFKDKKGLWWMCECECGLKKAVCGKNLIDGLSSSCRKCARRGLRNTLEDKEINDWIVGKRLPGYPIVYRCTCKCGKKANVPYSNLINNNSKRCRKCGVKAANLTKFNKRMARDPNFKWKNNKQLVSAWAKLKKRRPLPWANIDAMIADIGMPPTRKSRLVVSGPVSKESCRWVSGIGQGKKFRLFQGQMMSESELALKVGLTRERVRQRYLSHGDAAFPDDFKAGVFTGNGRKGGQYSFNGKTGTAKEIAQSLGVGVSSFYAYQNGRQLTLGEGRPGRKSTKENKVYLVGVKAMDILEIAHELGIGPHRAVSFAKFAEKLGLVKEIANDHANTASD